MELKLLSCDLEFKSTFCKISLLDT